MEVIYFIIILILIFFIFIAFYSGKAFGKRYMYEVMEQVIVRERKEAVNQSRAILKGQFSEQLSPFQEDFPVKPSECRFFGAPIDFIAFKGLDDKEVTEIIFIDIKTGSSRLNQTQKSIKEAIRNKKISFIEYRLE
jgi:predicted Holliday junction resolvase-like endonuclease